MMKFGKATILISIKLASGVADNGHCGTPTGVSQACDNPSHKCINTNDHSDCADNIVANACTCVALKVNGADCGNRTGIPFQCSTTDACLVATTNEDCGVNVHPNTCSCVSLKTTGADCGNLNGIAYRCVSTDSCLATATNAECDSDAVAATCSCVALKASGADCGSAVGAPFPCVGTDVCAEEGTNADCADNSPAGTCICVQIVATDADCGNENGLPFQCFSGDTCVVTATNAECGAYESAGTCTCVEIKGDDGDCGNPNGLPFQCPISDTCISTVKYPVIACPANAPSVDACRCVSKEKTCTTWGPSGYVMCNNIKEGIISDDSTFEKCLQLCLEDDECNDGSYVKQGENGFCLLMKGETRCCDNAFWNPRGAQNPTITFRCEGPKVYLTSGNDFCAFDMSLILGKLPIYFLIAASIALCLGCCCGCCCGWWCKSRKNHKRLVDDQCRTA
eukprot:GEMP01029581.1.p1 GENE.GEMP01029581.1~~GEMP01029581.1.p1  ORF type:complete len:452 (+),score=65.92 GEMP01029581.1:122-1477(+)